MSGLSVLVRRACPTEHRGSLLACCLVIAAGLLAYANSFSGVFLFDDGPSITENPCIRSLWPLPRALSAPPQAGVAGRPIASLSLAFNYALGGLNPWGYHAFNLAVHLLCGMLLFGFVRRTLTVPRLGERFGRSAVPLAMLVALLWVVHPLHTESVTYVIQRIESLMGLFYLLMLYCFVRGAGGGRRGFWYAGAIAACALGMLTKEAMVTAPAIVLFYDAIFAAGSLGKALKSRPGLYAGLAATWIILGVILIGAPRSETVGFSAGVRSLDYALNQCAVIVNYVGLAFWPHPLILDYGFTRQLPLAKLLPCIVILMLLLGGTTAALFCRPMLGFLGVWFFVILSPTSSFVPITSQVAAERRMYLPLAGIITLVIVGSHALIEAVATRLSVRASLLHRIALVLACTAAGVLGFLTHQRNKDYVDPVVIWQKTIAATPPNARAQCNLGAALFAAGRQDEGVIEFRRAVAISQGAVMLECNLATALWKHRQFDQAVALYEKILDKHPDHLEARAKLGRTLADMGRYEGAMSCYAAVLEVVRGGEDYVETLRNLAVAQAHTGHVNQAEDSLREALRCSPNDPNTHHALAEVLMRQGEYEKAVAEWLETLRLDPSHTEARRGLAQLYVRQSKLREAILEYEELLRRDPKDVRAQAAMGEARAKLERMTSP